MPWQNVRIEDIEGQAELKLISADYVDDAEFKDSPLEVTIQADPKNEMDIRNQFEGQLVKSRQVAKDDLNEEAILAILNAQPE